MHVPADRANPRSRGADGRFVPEKREITVTESRGEGAANAPRVSDEEYRGMVESARARKEAHDVEIADAAETRVVYKDEDVLTIVTAAMLVKFTLCWGDQSETTMLW